MATPPQDRRVCVSIPATHAYGLIYRQARDELFSVEPMAGLSFCLLRRPGDVRPLLGALRSRYGAARFAKTVLKLATPIRELYCVLHDGEIVHDGWLTISRCTEYWVEEGAVVVGPINTTEQWRGKGLAPYAMRLAMNSLMERGHRIVYVDTANDNLASQRAIAKCGFGDPVAVRISGRAE